MTLRAPAALLATLAIFSACGGDRTSTQGASANVSASATAAVQPKRPPRALMIVMDLSGSMRAVFDGTPIPGAPAKPARFDVQKDVVLDVITKEPDSPIGVVVFGAEAFILTKPTTDHAAVSALVSKLKHRTIDDSGSALGEGVTLAAKQFGHVGDLERTILVFADTENNGGGLTPRAGAEVAKSERCRVLAIQISEGGMADVLDGIDMQGTPRYVRQTFPANPVELKEIASITGGTFVLAKTPAELLDATRTLLR